MPGVAFEPLGRVDPLEKISEAKIAMYLIRRFVSRLRRSLFNFIFGDSPKFSYPNAVDQQLLSLAYKKQHRSGETLPSIADTGFKCFSQTDEDGILLFIFSVIGSKSKTCVELCSGDGIECNTANLIIHHGWHGLLVDGSKTAIAEAKNHYSRHPATYAFPPTIVESWVTRSNVNELLLRNGFSGEVDLLSLDMDGVDYWIFDAITQISPRVIVLEYQDILGPERSVTVPYSDSFSGWTHSTNGNPNYCGASITAFVRLAERKGYRLIGCNRLGFNAFFIKHELGNEIPTITAKDCFTHPKVKWGMKTRYPSVANLDWEEVCPPPAGALPLQPTNDS